MDRWQDINCANDDQVYWSRPQWVNQFRRRQNGHHFPDDIFKCIFLNENVWILIKISLKCVPEGPINNIQGLVQIMAWRRPADKPLSEPMNVNLLTHICVTRPQWVNVICQSQIGRITSMAWWIAPENTLVVSPLNFTGAELVTLIATDLPGWCGPRLLNFCWKLWPGLISPEIKSISCPKLCIQPGNILWLNRWLNARLQYLHC